MLTLLAKLLKALNSESSSRQIALAVALGFMVGLAPIFSVHGLFIILIVALIKVNLGAFILTIGLAKLASFPLSPLIVSIGESLLTSPALNGLFNSLYQINLFKLAHFHHTYMLGAVVLGWLLLVPIYFIAKFLVEKYRDKVMAYINKFKIVKAIKASKFYRIYLKFAGQGETI
ncbi:TIGR03546 family protein [Thalassotalea agarivorans]|uniref:TIGR03546 family protein n=1 Tax=Thalassotalea agarivorans TaxID=349064 RepID=A0A1H9Y0F9_THASX|nr:TIGR03546 family protein [Thalassotalea agarivorans]SES62140.1 TIGR03546 family protein [Thalassotalea agarivorans]